MSGREAVDAVEDGAQERVQRSESQLALGHGPANQQHDKSARACLRGSSLQHRGLTDSRVPDHMQRVTGFGHPIKRRMNFSQLGISPYEPWCSDCQPGED